MTEPTLEELRETMQAHSIWDGERCDYTVAVEFLEPYLKRLERRVEELEREMMEAGPLAYKLIKAETERDKWKEDAAAQCAATMELEAVEEALKESIRRNVKRAEQAEAALAAAKGEIGKLAAERPTTTLLDLLDDAELKLAAERERAERAEWMLEEALYDEGLCEDDADAIRRLLRDKYDAAHPAPEPEEDS